MITPIFVAYCLYFVVLGIAAAVYETDDTAAAVLVVTVLGLHFLLALTALEEIKTRYPDQSFRTAVTISTDLILSIDLVAASLWLGGAVGHGWGAYAIAAAFIGNAGCVYLRSNKP
jgi:hypothetical protein